MTVVVNAFVRAVLRILCRLDMSQLENIPRTGPFIMVTNHINFLEVPLLYTFLQPRPLIGLIKVETWRMPPLAFLANLWKAIPVKRGATDMAAFRNCLRALKQGKILAVAPEGTRSGTGQLGRGQPGVVHIALKGKVPVLPVVHYGGERFWSNLRRLRKTRIQFRVGRPFVLQPRAFPVTREERWEIVHEIMCRLAELLPAEYRGFYGERCLVATARLRNVDLGVRGACGQDSRQDPWTRQA